MTFSILDSVHGSIPGIAWPAVLEGPAATILALARHMEGSQWLDPATLRANQFRQLAPFAPWLAAHSPAFARRLKSAGLQPEALASAEGFGSLPPIERRWFRENDDIFCDAVPPQHEPIGENVTSGSTGEFLRVRRTHVCQLIWLAMVLRDHQWRNTDFSVPLATARAPSTGINRYPNWGPPATLFFETGPALSLPVSLGGEELLERLEEFGTSNLMIYPNALRLLVDAAEARGRPLESLRAIRTIGEIVDRDLRERTRRILGVEIADAYTCQEAGYLALQCPESELYHLMAEGAVVEVLRPDGSPCGPGETGKVVITDLHNFATPVVRYAPGDLAEVGEPCPCGRGLPTLRRIVGRSRNLILMPDGRRLWPSLGGLGHDGYFRLLPILQSQFIQTAVDRIEIRFVTERPLTSDEERLVTERAHKSLGYPFKFEFRYFEGRLPLPPSGKFEDFICLV